MYEITQKCLIQKMLKGHCTSFFAVTYEIIQILTLDC